MLEDEERCVGAGEHEFAWMFGILRDDHVDRIQIARVKVMALQNARGKSALQRRETEYCVAVAANDEPDQAVAKSTDAVVEDDGVGHG